MGPGFTANCRYFDKVFGNKAVMESRTSSQTGRQCESKTKQTAKKNKGKYGGRPESVNVQSLKPNSQDEEHALASTAFVPDTQKSDPSPFAPQRLSLILETQETNIPELSPSTFSGIFLEICCSVNSNLAESIQASFCGNIQMAVIRDSTRADFTMFHAQLNDLAQRFSKRPVYVHVSLQPSGNSDTREREIGIGTDSFMEDLFLKVGRHIYAQLPRLCCFPETDPKVGKIFLWLGTHPNLASSLANHTKCNCDSHVAFNAVNWDKVSHYMLRCVASSLRHIEMFTLARTWPSPHSQHTAFSNPLDRNPEFHEETA